MAWVCTLLTFLVLTVEGEIAADDLDAQIKKAKWELGKVYIMMLNSLARLKCFRYSA